MDVHIDHDPSSDWILRTTLRTTSSARLLSGDWAHGAGIL